MSLSRAAFAASLSALPFSGQFPYEIHREISASAPQGGWVNELIVWYATFADGTIKTLTERRNTREELVRKSDLGTQYIHPENNVLYFRDWTNCPKDGQFNGNYPPIPVVPDTVFGYWEMLDKCHADAEASAA